MKRNRVVRQHVEGNPFFKSNCLTDHRERLGISVVEGEADEAIWTTQSGFAMALVAAW